ncbi:MAG: peptide ABC transporter substrate-binding protein [Janthinobacterium lividum]
MKSITRVPAIRISAFAALTFLTGCGHHNNASSSGGNILRVAMQTAPVTFDPAMCQDVETGQMLQQNYEGLVQYAPDNKLIPCLAEKWDISPDGLTYTFHLRKATFQNGMPVTADDVAYSLRRTLDPKLSSPIAAQYMDDIKGALDVYSGKAADLTGVKVVDPSTVAITITKPKAYWIDTLTYPTAWVECKAIAQKEGTNPLTEADAEAGAGTGAYKIAHFVKDQEVDLDANPAYWDGAPKISGLVESVILNPGTRHEEFAAGKIDIMRGLQVGDQETDATDPALKSQIKVWPRAGTYYFALNQTVYAPFKDPRVRAAFAYATDKQKISQVVTQGVYPVAADLLPPGIPGAGSHFQDIPYDPAKARALLSAAGFPNGKGLPPLDIYTNEKNPLGQKTMDILRQMYSQTLGITVNERQMEFGSMIADINKNTVVPSFVLGWYADYLDPQDFYSLLLSTHSPENHTGYSDPQFDALCAQADVERNPTKRAALYRQAAQIAGSAPPRIPLYYAVDPELISSRVHGIDDCLMGHLPYKRVTLR